MSADNKKTRGLITIDSVIGSIIEDLGNEYENQRAKILRYVVEEYTNLNLFYIKSMETVILDVLPNSTVDMPYDYIDFIRIGLIKNDRVVTLSKTDAFAMVHSNVCGVDAPPDYQVYIPEICNDSVHRTIDNDFINTYPHYGENSVRKVGEFRINKAMRRIELSTNASQVYLEYLSSGISIEGDTLIPIQAREAIIEMVCYRVEKNSGTPANKVALRRQDMKEAKSRLYNFETGMTKSELLDIIRGRQTQTVKR